jgi:hypothetical protein
MVLDPTANFARSPVTSSVASGDTTISVSNADQFPDPANGAYNCVLWDTAQGRPDQDSSVEVVRVTAYDTTNDTLTVTRGQEGTSAVSHPNTSAVALTYTAILRDDIDAALEEIADFSASPTELTAPVNTSDPSSFGSLGASTIDNDDYHETVVSQSGSTGNIDVSAANVFKQTITGNISFSFNNPSSSPAGNSFTLIIEQDGTGGHTISWPTSVEWDSGGAPGFSTNANDKHMVGFVSPDGGSTWIGIPSARQIA